MGVIGFACGVGVGVSVTAGVASAFVEPVLPTALVNTSTTATSARHSKMAPDQKVYIMFLFVFFIRVPRFRIDKRSPVKGFFCSYSYASCSFLASSMTFCWTLPGASS